MLRMLRMHGTAAYTASSRAGGNRPTIQHIHTQTKRDAQKLSADGELRLSIYPGAGSRSSTNTTTETTTSNNAPAVPVPFIAQLGELTKPTPDATP